MLNNFGEAIIELLLTVKTLMLSKAMKNRWLLIGYGNVYCQDDGVAFYLINQIRRRLGIAELEPDEDGLDTLGRPTDTVMVNQLVPEIVPVISSYGFILFVDAHTGTIPDDVRVITVEEEDRFYAVTHHMSPGMLLSMARQTTGVRPEGYLLSVRGEKFDFGMGLSEPCRLRAQAAVEEILNLMQDQDHQNG